MTGIDRARLVTLQETGSEATGYITIAEESSGLPFVPAVVEWCLDLPTTLSDARIDTTTLPMLLVCLSGTMYIALEPDSSDSPSFTLTHPSQGLYIPVGSLLKYAATTGSIVLRLQASS